MNSRCQTGNKKIMFLNRQYKYNINVNVMIINNNEQWGEYGKHIKYHMGENCKNVIQKLRTRIEYR